MDQVQVQVIRPQFLTGPVKGFLGLFVAHFLHIGLGGQEKFLPGNAAFLDGGAHRFLILVAAGCVQQPVAQV